MGMQIIDRGGERVVVAPSMLPFEQFLSTVFGIAALANLVFGVTRPSWMAPLILLVYWFLHALALYLACLAKFGHEMIWVDKKCLSFRRTVFGMGALLEFQRENIVGLRLNERNEEAQFGFTRMLLRGKLAVDLFNENTRYFGRGLTKSEAQELVWFLKRELKLYV